MRCISRLGKLPFVLAVLCVASLACGGGSAGSDPGPTPVRLEVLDLDSSPINQLMSTEGWLESTGSLSCQTRVWVEEGKEEQRCTGIRFGDRFYDEWVDLALKRRTKSGLIIDWGLNNQQFGLYKGLQVFDDQGVNYLDTLKRMRVTGILTYSEESGYIFVVDTIKVAE